jgi:DNA-binding Lrp family transcriptional regulator
MKKHKTQITSVLSYYQVLNELGKRQREVYRILREKKSASNFMIAKELNLPINSITPRVKELRDKGVVLQHKKDMCPETQKLVIYWKPRRWDF